MPGELGLHLGALPHLGDPLGQVALQGAQLGLLALHAGMLEAIAVYQLGEVQLQRGVIGLKGLDELVLHHQREGLHQLRVFGDVLQHLRLTFHFQASDPHLDVQIVERGDLFHQDFLPTMWGENVLSLAECLEALLGLLDFLALLGDFIPEPLHCRLGCAELELDRAVHVCFGQGIDDLRDQLRIAPLEAERHQAAVAHRFDFEAAENGVDNPALLRILFGGD